MKIETQLSKAKRLFARRDFSAASAAIQNIPAIDSRDRLIKTLNLWFIASAMGNNDEAGRLATSLSGEFPNALGEIGTDSILLYDIENDGSVVLESEELDA